jgi:hypothetical protein
MLPMQGPGIPVTSHAFSSSVSDETNRFALFNAVSHPPVPVMLAEQHQQQASTSARRADLREGYTGGEYPFSLRMVVFAG